MGPKPRWMTTHHGPVPSPAVNVTNAASVPCFWMASAGLNRGLGLSSWPPEFSSPPATALSPPLAPPRAADRPASSSLAPPEAVTVPPAPRMSANRLRATDSIVITLSSSAP